MPTRHAHLVGLTAMLDGASRRLIHAASVGDHAEAVDALLCGADPRAAIDGQLDALMMACANNHPALVELLASSCDPASRDAAGNTYLHRCGSYGHADCVEALLRSAPWASGLLEERNNLGQTPFLSACERGDLDTVRALAAISDIHAKDAHGRGAVLLACLGGSEPALGFLLGRLDPLEIDDQGLDGLMSSCKAGSLECALAMLAICDPARRDPLGRTALSILCEQASSPSVHLAASWTAAIWREAFDRELQMAKILIGRGSPLGPPEGSRWPDPLSICAAKDRADLAEPIFRALLDTSHEAAFAAARRALAQSPSPQTERALREWTASARERIALLASTPASSPRSPAHL